MIITLCGSARFEEQFVRANKNLTLAGHVVFGLSVYPSQMEGKKDWYTQEEKGKLDAAHLRKIDASDAIVVLNVEGYVGESTAGEINWAAVHGKRVYYLEPTKVRRRGSDGPVWDLFSDLLSTAQLMAGGSW